MPVARPAPGAGRNGTATVRGGPRFEFRLRDSWRELPVRVFPSLYSTDERGSFEIHRSARQEDLDFRAAGRHRLRFRQQRRIGPHADRRDLSARPPTDVGRASIIFNVIGHGFALLLREVLKHGGEIIARRGRGGITYYHNVGTFHPVGGEPRRQVVQVLFALLAENRLAGLKQMLGSETAAVTIHVGPVQNGHSVFHVVANDRQFFDRIGILLDGREGVFAFANGVLRLPQRLLPLLHHGLRILDEFHHFLMGLVAFHQLGDRAVALANLLQRLAGLSHNVGQLRRLGHGYFVAVLQPARHVFAGLNIDAMAAEDTFIGDAGLRIGTQERLEFLVEPKAQVNFAVWVARFRQFHAHDLPGLDATDMNRRTLLHALHIREAGPQFVSLGPKSLPRANLEQAPASEEQPGQNDTTQNNRLEPGQGAGHEATSGRGAAVRTLRYYTVGI